MKLKPGEKITDDHFRGTFMFPHDLDWIAEETASPFFCAVFNDMIDNRIKCHNDKEKLTALRKSGKFDK